LKFDDYTRVRRHASGVDVFRLKELHLQMTAPTPSPANMLKIGYGVLLAVVGAGADDGSVVAAEMSGTD